MNWPPPIGRCRALLSVVHWALRLSLVAILLDVAGWTSAAESPSAPVFESVQSVVDEYCANCHDADEKKGGLDLDGISSADITKHPDQWEHVIRQLAARQMPPIGKERPADAMYDDLVRRLSASLDAAAEENPNPGRTETFRRLNRTEYQNAIRDLLGSGDRRRGASPEGRGEPWL